MNEQVITDITFLLSFCPALNTASIPPNLSPMFYLTGTYDGDIKVISRIEDIVSRYQINSSAIQEHIPGEE